MAFTAHAAPMKRYRHFSFDLDGTLVHTTAAYRHESVRQVLTMLGGTLPTDRVIDAFWFEARRDEIIRDDFGVAPGIFWPAFHAHDTIESRGKHTSAYPEVESTLRDLRTMGRIVSVITGAPPWISKMEIGKLNRVPLNYLFSITGSRFPSKPHPASFAFVLSELNCQPDETVYIGNSSEDALFAANAGVDFIYLERREHEFHGRDSAIATLHSLAELL